MNNDTIDNAKAEGPSSCRDVVFLLRILPAAYLRKAGAKVECVAKRAEKRESGLD
jgi:hypothetical protein